MKNPKPKNQIHRLKSVLCLAAVLGASLASLEAQTNGTVVAWGDNQYGQTNIPAGLGKVLAVAAGVYHNTVLTFDGTVAAWGDLNYQGSTNVPAGLSGVIAVAAGSFHSLALKSDGTVVAWGDNRYGQINVPAGLSGVIGVAGGRSHSLALKSDGTVVAWGDNYDGQTNVPAGLSGVIAVSAGGLHSLALKSDGTVVAWGYNSYGQASVPAGLTGVIAVSAGSSHNLALKHDGTVVAWGNNFNGPTNVPAGLSGVIAVAAGGEHSLALKSDGTIVAWGRNAFGMMNVPAGLSGVIAIAVGGDHYLALVAAPVVLTPPASQEAHPGYAVEFSTDVAGASPFFYQWFFNTTNYIVGATNSVLQLTNVQFSQAGAYTVVVTNTFGAVTSAPAWLSVVSRVGGGVVTDCTEAELRAALTGGGLVTFACDGTITVTNTITITAIAENTVLDATGHQVTISGNNAVRVFYINPNVTLTLINLTIANGRAPVVGMLPAEAGGVLNLGTLNATNCTFRNHLAQGALGAGGPDNGAPAHGAAILNGNGATFNASRCSFLVNRALGGWGTNGLSGSQTSSPGSGHSGGPARGGAIYNAGTMTIESSLFASNGVAGGTGGRGGGGIWCYVCGAPSQTGGAGGSGGEGNGAAIFNANTAVLVNCTFAWNSGAGGGSGAGGSGGIVAVTPHYEHAYPGGNGGNGGSGLGVISGPGSALRMTNCTVALNSVSGGAGAAGGGGTPSGASGSNGSVSGCLNLNGASLINVLLANNTPGNCSGTITDLGHNLSSDSSCNFTNVGSLNSTDPKLGPLADNGGSVLTMAFLPGSPAIDAGDNASAPTTDQRGFPRPAGIAADIGAYEYCYLPVLRATLASADVINVTLFTTNNQTCRLFTSSDLVNWQCVATNQIGADGTVLFQDNCNTGETQRFYRAVMP